MVHIYKIRFIGILFLLLLLLPGFDTPNDINIAKILRQIAKFRREYRQQKVHLHTDKDVYLASENIWIKSYLTNGSTLVADSVSKEVFVDLIDYNNKPISTIILRNINGYGQGKILISDTLTEGNYQLRGYTNWMRNFDEDFFFNKTITIKNPNYENIVTRKRLQIIKQFNHKRQRIAQRISMQFMPEGGYLINGIESKVAYKIENDLGEGIKATGAVYANKTKICDISTIHNGMGYFILKPETGKRYTCTMNYSDKKKETFELPEAIPKGIVMAVNSFDKDAIKLSIISNRDISQNIAENEIKVVAQSRNSVLYISKVEIKGSPIEVEVPKKIFPAGIAQITLFDSRNEPLCERLIFIDPNSQKKLTQIKLSGNNGVDSSKYSISMHNSDGLPVKGNFSVSVRELLPGENTSEHTNILTNLLLTSDLKGRIEKPWYYFSGTAEAEKDVDLLMLTHGWRRFSWKNILNNHYPPIFCEPNLGVSIGGKITRDFFEIPVPDAKVKLTIKSSYNDVFELTANQKGRFLFPDLNYEDTIDILIEAFKPSGGKGVLIILGDTLIPNIITTVTPYALNETFPKEKIKANIKRERIAFKKNYKKREPDNQMFKIHQTPNDVIYVGEDANNYSDILSYMQGRIPGVNITGNKVIIRGVSTFYGSTDPLFLIDGIPIDASSVSMINPQDIAIIEVLKGPEASIYGSRGANGVIAFYTKRGHFMKRGQIELSMLGYQKVREFYVPNYDDWQYKPSDYNIPRTIYWKPELITDTNGNAILKFKNQFGNKSQYITIEGLTDTGEILWLEKTISN